MSPVQQSMPLARFLEEPTLFSTGTEVHELSHTDTHTCSGRRCTASLKTRGILSSMGPVHIQAPANQPPDHAWQKCAPCFTMQSMHTLIHAWIHGWLRCLIPSRPSMAVPCYLRKVSAWINGGVEKYEREQPFCHENCCGRTMMLWNI